MPFYIRKYVSLGPVRFNLSKSGIGTSVGVKGLRFGSGPRGNYVHMGRHGLYFRKSLGTSSIPRTKNRQYQKEKFKEEQTIEQMRDIDSLSVDNMIDSSSQELLDEINRKLNAIRLFPFAFLLGFIAIIVILGSYLDVWLKVIYSLFVLGILGCVYSRDLMVKSIVILFDMEEPARSHYLKLYECFKELLQCKGTWHVIASSRIQNEKHYGGANENVRRKEIKLAVGRLPLIKTNVDIPQIPVGKQTLAFMPDRLLVIEGKKVGAVAYEDLNLNISSQRFVEGGKIPSDAKIVGQTWKYVNKDGGPDRRFKDNPQYQIAHYELIQFESSSGLNEEICLSRIGFGSLLEQAVSELSLYLNRTDNQLHT